MRLHDRWRFVRVERYERVSSQSRTGSEGSGSSEGASGTSGPLGSKSVSGTGRPPCEDGATEVGGSDKFPVERRALSGSLSGEGRSKSVVEV